MKQDALNKWSKIKLDDDAFYFELVSEVIQEALVYLYSPKGQVIPEILLKMEKGAKEHGNPILPLDTIKEELQNEFRDLVGWKMVEKWNKLQNK